MFFLDARTKLLFVFLFTLLVFIIDTPAASGCLLLFSAVIRISAGFYKAQISTLSFKTGGFRFPLNLTLLAAFIILIQTVFGPGDTYILKPLFPDDFLVFAGTGSLKREGLILGIVIVLRLASLVIILPVFTQTTPAYKIAAGLCAAGLGYRTAFIITMAFNLIPFFREEALVIMDAQKLRGMSSFERGNKGRKGVFFSRFKAYAGLLLPLMLGAMKKAQRASIAMDSRAFGIYKKRTWIDKPVMKTRDFACISGFIIIFFAVLIANFTIF